MIFQYSFLDEHRCVKITIIGRQCRERNSRLWRLNQKFYSPRKMLSELHCKLLVALAIVSVAILSPEIEQLLLECRKVIGFAITTLLDWLKDLHHFFIQSEVKPKPIATHSLAFSHALHQLHVIYTSSFDWFTILSVFFVIG